MTGVHFTLEEWRPNGGSMSRVSGFSCIAAEKLGKISGQNAAAAAAALVGWKTNGRQNCA